MIGILKALYFRFLPQRVRDKFEVLIGMSDYYDIPIKSTGCLFIHVPKAAGTSVSRAIYGENIGHFTAQFYRDLSKREFNKYFKFAIVRNPWDRAVSAYHFVKQGGTDLVQPNADEDFSNDCFESFERFVKEWLTVVDISKKDVVFQPQYWFICDENENVLVDYIGKLEKMDEVSQVLTEKLNKKFEFEKLNVSKRKKDFRSYYNAETKALVSEIYKKDIELFGYEFE